MESAKEQVQQILELLPDDASLEDIQYHIFVRQKIEDLRYPTLRISDVWRVVKMKCSASLKYGVMLGSS